MPIQTLIFLLVGHIVVPIAFIVSLWRAREHDWLNWLLKVLYSGTFLLVIGLYGRWDWVSYYLLVVFAVLFLVAVVVSFRRSRGLPFVAITGVKQWLGTAGSALTLLFFVGILVVIVRGYFYSGDPVRLAFPLRDG